MSAFVAFLKSYWLHIGGGLGLFAVCAFVVLRIVRRLQLRVGDTMAELVAEREAHAFTKLKLDAKPVGPTATQALRVVRDELHSLLPPPKWREMVTDFLDTLDEGHSHIATGLEIKEGAKRGLRKMLLDHAPPAIDEPAVEPNVSQAPQAIEEVIPGAVAVEVAPERSVHVEPAKECTS